MRKVDADPVLLLVFGIGAEISVIGTGSTNHYADDVV